MSLQIEIGTPAYYQGRTGYVAAVMPPAGVSYALGAPGGPRRTTAELEIVWPHRVESIADSIAATWIEAAQRANIPPLPVAELQERKAAALQAQRDAREARETERNAEQVAREAFKAEAARRMPAGAKAVIIAELHRDDSDSMSDYFNHKTERRVLLAWSGHTRDLFPELRKAAALFPETAHLATAPESAEHREKYSMGAGFYLKQGFRDSTGWAVKKARLYQGVASLDRCEFLPDAPSPSPVAQTDAPAPSPVTGARVESHIHTKHGWAFWIVILPSRVERAEYEALLSKARAAGGWYSRPWGTTPGGFAFKVEAAAREFAQGLQPSPASPVAQADATPVAQADATPSPARPRVDVAQKLRGLADAMDSAIAHKLGDRLENTPKRAREAQSQRLEGYRLQRTQRALRALADCHEAGNVPRELLGVTSKKVAYDLLRAEIKSAGGYYDAGHETGRPALDTPAARLLWDMAGTRSAAEREAAELQAKIKSLRFANIPGFFPTPAPVIARMLQAAAMPAGPCDVLEPSAGAGAILDAIKAAHPAARLMAFERHATLREILQAKGYTLAGADFADELAPHAVDFVLMNPPFERAQDIEHVRIAHGYLRPGGRLVAIMSGGTFQRTDSKAAEFRAWVEAQGGTWEALPEGSFKESGTGVNTVLVTVDAGRP